MGRLREVDGIACSASIAALRCIRKIGSNRRSADGCIIWKTQGGVLINKGYKKLDQTG